jgi:hypothetical protein
MAGIRRQIGVMFDRANTLFFPVTLLTAGRKQFGQAVSLTSSFIV